MMSGIRNSPPISISSPRETGTGLPFASAASVRSSAAAQLFTTSASSEPVSEASNSSAREVLRPRAPVSPVHLEIGVASRRTRDRAHRGSGERRAAEVRVQHHPGRVDHRRQAERGGSRASDGTREELVGHRRLDARGRFGPDLLERARERALQHGTADHRGGAHAGPGPQQRVHRRDLPAHVARHGSEPTAGRRALHVPDPVRSASGKMRPAMVDTAGSPCVPEPRGHQPRARRRRRHHPRGRFPDRGDDPQHRAAAPVHARRAPDRARARRRGDHARRAGDRLHAPRRREARGVPRRAADARADEPPRLALRVQQRARLDDRGGAARRDRGAGPRAVDPHDVRRVEPDHEPPRVHGFLPARARRDDADLLRVPRA